jgi:hypothetical protein
VSETARSLAVLGLIAAGIAWAVGLTSSGWVGPAREYSGIYERGFEHSTFIEGAQADNQQALDQTNNGYVAEKSIVMPPQAPCPSGSKPKMETFEIRFIGRRKPGPAGHFGMSPAEYLVERVIDIRPLDNGC